MRQLPVPDPGTPDLRSAHHFVIWLMKQQRASVLLGILWGSAWMISQALVPAAIGAAIDALAGHKTGAFTLDCLAVLGLGILAAVTGVLRHRRVVSNFLDAAYRVIQLVTAQSAALGNTLTKLITTGEVVSVGTADVDAIGGGIDVTGRGSGALAAVIVVAAILLARSLPLGLVVLIGAPIMTALVSVLLKPLHRRQQRYRDQQGALATRAADIVAGLRVLRGIGGESAFRARYRDQSQSLRYTGVHVARTESFLDAAELLLPGLFVNIRLIIGNQNHAFLVTQAAVRRDSTGAFVQVVGSDGRVVQKRVQAETMLANNWIITQGLEDGDQIIVSGVDKVKPGTLARAVPYTSGTATIAGADLAEPRE